MFCESSSFLWFVCESCFTLASFVIWNNIDGPFSFIRLKQHKWIYIQCMFSFMFALKICDVQLPVNLLSLVTRMSTSKRQPAFLICTKWYPVQARELKLYTLIWYNLKRNCWTIFIVYTMSEYFLIASLTYFKNENEKLTTLYIAGYLE